MASPNKSSRSGTRPSLTPGQSQPVQAPSEVTPLVQTPSEVTPPVATPFITPPAKFWEVAQSEWWQGGADQQEESGRCLR